MKDKVFESPYAEGTFCFDEQVAKAFDDMVHRSIPLYKEVQDAILTWLPSFYQKGSWIYDIGCSTGALIREILRAYPDTWVHGIEPSPFMIEQAQSHITQTSSALLSALPVQEVALANASIVIINYTLQFISVPLRASILQQVYRAILPGGLVVLSEKTQASHEVFRAHEIEQYEAFKRRNGYSEREIQHKKHALKHVLIPLTLQENIKMLQDAGFKSVEVMFRQYHFVTLVGIK